MSETICMVTGATSGLGKVTARALAEQGATVIVVGRSLSRAEATVTRIVEQTGNARVTYFLADLSSQSDIRRLAAQLERRYGRLHVLVNNAGAAFGRRQESVDGIEMTLALNHLGYFLLTDLLLPALKAAAPSRIINVASAAHAGSVISFDDLQGRQKYNRFKAYGQSKLANILFTYELARRLEGTGVTVNAVHPGLVATNFGLNNRGILRLARRLVNMTIALDAEKGAESIIALATSPEYDGVTGRYFVKGQAAASSQASYDQATARRLWTISANLTARS